MKNILLASTAIIAFAGSAYAAGHTNIAITGDATVGYNDDIEDGFYWDSGIDFALSATLDNGLTAGASFDFNIADDDDADTVDFDDYELHLTSDMAGLYYGVTDFAAETLWQSSGDMAGDSFSEASDEIVLRGEVTFGDVKAAMSYAIEDDAGTEADDDFTQLSVAAVGTFGNFTVGAAYQEESGTFGGAAAAGNGDYNMDEVFGIFASTTVSGADVSIAYASETNNDEDSLGLEVEYAFSTEVTVGAYYVIEDGDDAMGVSVDYANGPVTVAAYFNDDRGSQEYALQGAYDVGNGLVLIAGIIDGDSDTDNDFANYIGAEYDLGGGAAFNAYYADGNNTAGSASDDIDVQGSRELKHGVTAELTLAF